MPKWGHTVPKSQPPTKETPGGGVGVTSTLSQDGFQHLWVFWEGQRGFLGASPATETTAFRCRH